MTSTVTSSAWRSPQDPKRQILRAAGGTGTENPPVPVTVHEWIPCSISC